MHFSVLERQSFISNQSKPVEVFLQYSLYFSVYCRKLSLGSKKTVKIQKSTKIIYMKYIFLITTKHLIMKDSGVNWEANSFTNLVS